MKAFEAKDIRNVALIGHAGSGKTSLGESMLFAAKATDRMGNVESGTTAGDYGAEEIKRKTTISLSVLPFEYKSKKINLIDAPGQFDFEAESNEAIAAVDNVIIVVSGKSGVTFGVKKAFKLAKAAGKSIIFFITKLDSESADFYRVLESLKYNFGPSVCPLTAPVYKGNKMDCLVDLMRKKAYRYDGKSKKEIPPPDMEHRLKGLETAINEAVAESDEKLFDKYFSGEQFTEQEVITGIDKGIASNSIYPVLCGSALDLAGIEILLDSIVELFPSAARAQTKLSCPKGFSALVFKTTVDPFYGKLSYIRVYSGSLKPGDVVKINGKSQSEKISKLIVLFGKKQEEIRETTAGDIAAVAKVDIKTNDLIYTEKPIDVKPVEFPAPNYMKAVSTTKDESKLSSAINKLLEEDPSLKFYVNDETRQQVLCGLSDQHLDTALSKLKNKFGVEVELEEVKIPYRETIRKKVKAHGRHKKQTGGHGQFGEVWIEFEPALKDELEFVEKIFGGAVPKGYFPAVEKGLKESAKKGLLAGYPMVGIKAVLIDGSYHPVDSSEMAFKMAANLAYKEGIPNASPVLLEPIYEIKISVPDPNTGDIMGELNKRRARVLGMEPDPKNDGVTVIMAEIPQAESLDFSTVVRRITQGAGYYTMEFKRYEQLPEALHSQVIAKS